MGVGALRKTFREEILSPLGKAFDREEGGVSGGRLQKGKVSGTRQN